MHCTALHCTARQDASGGSVDTDDGGEALVSDDIEGFIEDLDRNFDGRVSWGEYLTSLRQQQFNVPLTNLEDV